MKAINLPTIDYYMEINGYVKNCLLIALFRYCIEVLSGVFCNVINGGVQSFLLLWFRAILKVSPVGCAKNGPRTKLEQEGITCSTHAWLVIAMLNHLAKAEA
jgi:hypothetical protein